MNQNKTKIVLLGALLIGCSTNFLSSQRNESLPELPDTPSKMPLALTGSVDSYKNCEEVETASREYAEMQKEVNNHMAPYQEAQSSRSKISRSAQMSYEESDDQALDSPS
jgi:hypothetical protein